MGHPSGGSYGAGSTPRIRSPLTRTVALVEEPSTRCHLPRPSLARRLAAAGMADSQMRSRQEKCSMTAAELGAPREGVFAGGLPYLALGHGEPLVYLPGGTPPPQPAARVSATADFAYGDAIRRRRLRSVLHHPLAGNEHRYHLARGHGRPRSRSGRALRPACLTCSDTRPVGRS